MGLKDFYPCWANGGLVLLLLYVSFRKRGKEGRRDSSRIVRHVDKKGKKGDKERSFIGFLPTK